MLGTPAYMAPEQARGEVDRWTSGPTSSRLGSILCEILTGRPAFTGRTAGEIQRKAARGDLADALARLDALRGRRRADGPRVEALRPEPGDRPRRRGGRRAAHDHISGGAGAAPRGRVGPGRRGARAEEAVRTAEAAEAHAGRSAGHVG